MHNSTICWSVKIEIHTIENTLTKTYFIISNSLRTIIQIPQSTLIGLLGLLLLFLGCWRWWFLSFATWLSNRGFLFDFPPLKRLASEHGPGWKCDDCCYQDSHSKNHDCLGKLLIDIAYNPANHLDKTPKICLFYIFEISVKRKITPNRTTMMWDIFSDKRCPS